MHRRLPDALTWSRLAAVPVLWALALLRLPTAVGVGTALAGLTDVLDGMLARRMRVASRRGGALDSAADLVLGASLVAWLGMLAPDFVREQRTPLLLWAAFGVLVLAAGWLRFGQVGNLHLYSAKVAGVAAYLFGVSLLVTGRYLPAAFAVVMVLLWAAALESLLVILLRRGVRDHGGSVFARRPGGDRAEPPHADRGIH
jgi:phosphatidylglycerophosphate synthase